MAETYKIKQVKKVPKEWKNEHGNFKTWLIQVEGNGEPIQLNKKADSPDPQEGDELYGTILETDYGQKFKSEKKPFVSKTNGYDSKGNKHGNALKIAGEYLIKNMDYQDAEQGEFVKDLEALAKEIYAIPVPED